MEKVWQEYIWAIAQARDYGPLGSHEAPAIAAVLSLVDQIPTELLATMPAERYQELLLGTGALRTAVDTWARQGTGHLMRDLRKLGNPLYLVYRALKEAKDEAPSEQTTALAFVTDVDLRDALRLDIAEVDRALSEGRWKSATVIGGSVIEALLLWAIDKIGPTKRQTALTAALGSKAITKAPSTNTNDWVLAELVPVAEAAGLITSETRKQCDLARGFRNLVHPGRAVRLQQQCDQGTAFAAGAAMAFVTRDLEKANP
jgi:hypothetical protein